MLEGDISQLMSELKESAEALNEESQSVQSIIQEVEGQLCELALEMELWLEDSPMSTRELSVSASNVAPHIEVQLGFARHTVGSQSEWKLQLREAEYVLQTNVTEGPDRKLMRVLSRKNLHNAPREELIAAVAKLPALIQCFTSATRDRIEVIRGARKLLES